MRRWTAALGLVFLLLAGWREASGYAHFVRYLNRGGGVFQPANTRFDLRALPGRQVPYFISSKGPERLAEGDTFAALVSQIQSAAEVWNTVKTSELRLAFGGFTEPGAALEGPRIEVIFDEIPPGLVAMAGPEVLGDVAEEQGVPFIPIVRSLLVLPSNLAEPARPSWSERLYQTIVHELGHTFGLQHSWASGTMSTEITRATTKGSPLGADDVAGVSVLYPARNFREQTATISGRVFRAGVGAGVPLASVVAFSPTGDAVSVLTGPDGRYLMEGLKPGSYYLYVHPLPPSLQGEPQPVNLDLPLGPDGPVQPGGAFNLVFYPGTAQPEMAVEAKAGQQVEPVDFWVTSRDRVNLHSVQTYRFFGQQAVKPAFFHPGQTSASMILFGYGMSAQTGPVAGLSASPLRAPETLLRGPVAYATAPSYLQLDFSVPSEASAGPRHLLFRLGSESHVAPAAYRVARRTPPVIETVAPNADGTVTLRGRELESATEVRFDGAAAKVLSRENGELRVQPPAGLGSHIARITVFDADGQSSAMVDGGTAHVYTYPARNAPSLRVKPSVVARGVEAVLEVEGEGAGWTSALKAGFGSSAVTVRRVWRVSPSRILIHIQTGAAQTSAPLALTLADGVDFAVYPRSLDLHPAGVSQYYVLTSALTGDPVFPGSELQIPVGNLRTPLFASTTEVRIGGQAATLLGVNGSTAVVRVPRTLNPGPALIEMTIAGETVLPGGLLISDETAAQPSIAALQSVFGAALSSDNPPAPGELIRILVTGLPEDPGPAAGFKAASGELEHAVVSVEKTAGGHILLVRLSDLAPRGSTLELVVSYQGVSTPPVAVPVH